MSTYARARTKIKKNGRRGLSAHEYCGSANGEPKFHDEVGYRMVVQALKMVVQTLKLSVVADGRMRSRPLAGSCSL